MVNIDKIFLTAGEGKVYNKAMEITEKALIEEALKRSFGNRTIASKLLGINRNTLRFKINRLGIDVRRFRI